MNEHLFQAAWPDDVEKSVVWVNSAVVVVIFVYNSVNTIAR